jgi:hypothetical protein
MVQGTIMPYEQNVFCEECFKGVERRSSEARGSRVEESDRGLLWHLHQGTRRRRDVKSWLALLSVL